MNKVTISTSTESDILERLDTFGEDGVSPQDIHSDLQEKYDPDLIRRAIQRLHEQGKVSIDCSLKIKKNL